MESIEQKVDFAFIDSGTGGIPYVTYLKEKAPYADCVYVADTKNFPYGEKTNEQICSSVISLCKKIIERFSPKVIVIACNTMSVNALDAVRKEFPQTKFVGTVPAIKLAASVSKKRCIGLLATNSTVNHPYNKKLMQDYASDCKLVLRGDPELISFIEHKSFTASEEEKLEAVKPCVDFFREAGCDVIMLGCTHFLNLIPEFKKICGQEISVVDSKDGVVRRALSIVDSELNKNSSAQKTLLYITDVSANKDVEEYKIICSKFNLEWKSVFEI